MSEEIKHKRTIRSFVKREGRLTPGQERALKEQWENFGIDAGDERLNFAEIFGREAPVNLEIGFGKGEALLNMGQLHPDRDYIGIEVHRPGVGHLLHQIVEHNLKNVRAMTEDAVEVLKKQIPDNSLDKVFLFFPDPWHKKKHHKRRILQPEFAELIASKLKTGGHFHLATDWEHYAEQMMEVMSASASYKNTAGENNYAPRFEDRPITKFERRGQRLGHGTWDLDFEKISS